MSINHEPKEPNPKRYRTRRTIAALAALVVSPGLVGCGPNTVAASPAPSASGSVTPGPSTVETATPSPSPEAEEPEMNEVYGGLENDIENLTPEQEAYLAEVGQGIFDDAEGYDYEKDFKELPHSEQLLWQLAALRHLQKENAFALQFSPQYPTNAGEAGDPLMVTDIDPTSLDGATTVLARNVSATLAAGGTGNIAIEETDETGNKYTPLNANASAILFGLDAFRPYTNTDPGVVDLLSVTADFIREGKQSEYIDLSKVAAESIQPSVKAGEDGKPQVISLKINGNYFHPASKIKQRPAPTVTNVDATFSTEHVSVKANPKTGRPAFSFWSPYALSKYRSNGSSPAES